MKLSSRPYGFVVLLILYILAAVLGILVFRLLPGLELLPRLFAADTAATLFVYMTGLLFRNSSVYDPYWSVAPPVMLLLLQLELQMTSTGIVLLSAVILFWAVRLTAHWSTTFRGLKHEDWRYADFRENNPRLWFLINLFGINLFPTIVVFLVMVPAFLFVQNAPELSAGILAGALVSLFAAGLQGVSDLQMRAFRRVPENRGLVNRTGLWKYIRHPNYLGEVLMWWGVFLMLFFARPALWPAVLGPVVNTLMFVFVSVPLMEKRQLKRRPEYAAYRAETGALLPRPSRRKYESAR
jgi:steroid 5-alpha reductase family enzyme